MLPSTCLAAIHISLIQLSFVSASNLQALDNAPVLHYTLFRRGGVFAATEPTHQSVNTTYLARELDRTEKRYTLTKREVKGNKLVRKAKGFAGGSNGGELMSNVHADGIW